jgi:chemotaxis protein CheD
VAPGDHAITAQQDEMLSTLLGSCVAACLVDPEVGIGGMNHFLLPTAPRARNGSDELDGDIVSLAYGDTAMEVLINTLLKAGANRHRLRAKVFGGAGMHAGMGSFEVGKRNIQFVERFLASEQIPVMAQDTGGTASRRVVFHPFTGKVHVNQLSRRETTDLCASEARYARTAAKPRATSLEMF